ncbi:hypothetical protein ACFOET_14020 [Parapedobacter deserti]|uniref:Lipocalin-like domain-containing protein n=1 Tax=Parapedobacter deserti TaxID=1912957 RepID=A0ABV7JPJ0_9SPHI
MRMNLNLKAGIMVLLAGVIGCGMSACKKDAIRQHGLDAEQLVAGRLDGTWANPSSIITPDDVPAEVFGAMRLVFTTDDAGYPAQFIAKDCPIVFSATAGTWGVSGNENEAKVTLTGVEPVNEFTARLSTTTLTLSFFMGWENTDTGDMGKGNFSVTLTRQ